MIRTWPGQTKEEWLEERRRNQSLTPEERERELDEFCMEMEKKDEQRNSKTNQQNAPNPFEGCDHPHSLENTEATIIWIAVMAIATIFKGNWIIWIIATIIWRKYITRHKIKK